MIQLLNIYQPDLVPCQRYSIFPHHLCGVLFLFSLYPSSGAPKLKPMPVFVRPVLAKYKMGEICFPASLSSFPKPFPFLPLLRILFFLFSFSSLSQPSVFLNQRCFQKRCEIFCHRLKYSSQNLISKLELKRKKRF